MTSSKQDCIVPSEPLILKGTMEHNAAGSYRRANGVTMRDRSQQSYSRPRENSRSPLSYEKARDQSWSSSPRSDRRRYEEDEHMDNQYDRRSTSPRMQRELSRDGELYARRSTKENRVLGVFNLPRGTTEQDLDRLFSQKGEVEKINVVQRMEARRSQYAFVRFRHLQDAIAAQGDLNATTFMGRKIRVDFSLTNRPHSRTPGQYMGHTTRHRRGPWRQHRKYDRYEGGRSPSPRNARRYRSRSPQRRRYRSRSRSPSRRYRHRRAHSNSRNRSYSRSHRRHHR
ncbi:hypothetical protein IWQ62_001236 [Dispira parvispora]|uniref:RRM domain-containing protein n=1 Tax=Dispira parvispora TaxID=1520584 RepID=A0A9W8AWK7_9FUNG|nr:hypothetical protein IWQ62_001236 [Dispira parvispora]